MGYDLKQHQSLINDLSHKLVEPKESDKALLIPTIKGLLGSKSSDEPKSEFLERISNDLINLLGFESISTISDVITQISNDHSIFEDDDLNQNPSKSNNQQSSSSKIEDELQSESDIKRNIKSLIDEPVPNPHIFCSSTETSSQPISSSSGSKFVLPIGTTRSFHEAYEEIIIPPNQKIPMRCNERLIQISELDPICKRSFSGYTSLNRLQSSVFPTAYKTNENMLVCAPTGAGKTDVAMLAVLRAISQYGGLNLENPLPKSLKNSFKVIYVAPMKALASEVVRKMEKRLGWLGMVVKELTGDMQLTREEIDSTHFIVTTPEKWDVVTRKSSGEEDLVSRVRLLIIDEVHLLHEERGAVIETIVARTLRQVESSQSLIRIVGLSATLPNYLDVSDFLRVNQLQGLFYFDSSFRPVPLEQHFIGVRGKPNSQKSRSNLDIATFEKVSELIKEGHQVMVFVHARKETVKTAEMLRDRAKEEGLLELFDPTENPRFDSFARDLGGSKNKQMKDLAKDGFGIHHAGMLRSDRNISEKLFEAGVTKLLCCTATLAWGVNLPAYAVIIKGTQIYDSSKGSFVDLGILDVLQIFGRAGRPQYEDHGVGYICTTQDRLDHYVAAITQQHPIESQFVAGMVDSLNAEIALGTVRSIDEGVRWIGWTYLFVRMRKNPLVYGITISDVEEDPFLGSRRHTLIEVAAKKLQKIGMISFDDSTGSLQPTELGKIASKFYIKNASIEVFNNNFRPKMSEADVLAMISESVEFDQIKVRESEAEELSQLEKEAPCQVKGGPTCTAGKVNILLQAYVSRLHIEDFALVSDTAYVAQNAARIAKALVDIGVWKRLAETARVIIEIAKCIDKQIWPFMHPLIQSNLSEKLVYDLDQRAGEIEIEELVEMKASEIGKLCRLNDRLGLVILKAAKQFPRLSINYTLQPLSSDLLRVRIHLEHKFDWSSQVHGHGEPFWVWLEDREQQEIFRITKLYLRSTSPKFDLDLLLTLTSRPNLNFFGIRVISDRWVGAEDLKEVPLDGLVHCPPPPHPTPLLDLPLLSTSQLKSFNDHPQVIGLSSHLNPAETQCFHTIYNTPHDSLICAPEQSVSRNLTIIAIARALKLEVEEEKRIFVVVPRFETVKIFIKTLADALRNFPVQVGSGFDQNQGKQQHQNGKQGGGGAISQVTVITPRFGLGLPRRIEGMKKALTIFVDLHDLSEDYELFIGRVLKNWHETRLIGFSTSLSDARSLSTWLGIDQRMVYNFPAHSRSNPISVEFQPVTAPYSSSQWKTMVLPVWSIIQGSGSASIMIFVPSRNTCQGLAKSLIQFSASTITQNGPSCVDEAISEYYIRKFKDEKAADLLRHEMMILSDRMTNEEFELTIDLYRRRMIKVLITTRDLSWKISNENVRGEIVILMGTQYGATESVEVRDQEVQSHLIKRVELSELVQIQSFVGGNYESGEGLGKGVVKEEDSVLLRKIEDSQMREKRFVVMSEEENLRVYESFLRRGLPIESKVEVRSKVYLDEILDEFFSKDRNSKLERIGTGFDRSDLMRYFSEKFLFQRIQNNPFFYGINIRDDTIKIKNGDDDDELGEEEEKRLKEEKIKLNNLRLSRVIDMWIEELVSRSCVRSKRRANYNNNNNNNNSSSKDERESQEKFEPTRIGENLLRENLSIVKIDETISKIRRRFIHKSENNIKSKNNFGKQQRMRQNERLGKESKKEEEEEEVGEGLIVLSKKDQEFVDGLKLKNLAKGKNDQKKEGGGDEEDRFKELMEEGKLIYKRFNRQLRDRIGKFPTSTEPNGGDNKDKKVEKEIKKDEEESLTKKDEKATDDGSSNNKKDDHQNSLKVGSTEEEERWIKRLMIFSFEEEDSRKKLQSLITFNSPNNNQNKNKNGNRNKNSNHVDRSFLLLEEEMSGLIFQLIKKL